MTARYGTTGTVVRLRRIHHAVKRSVSQTGGNTAAGGGQGHVTNDPALFVHGDGKTALQHAARAGEFQLFMQSRQPMTRLPPLDRRCCPERRGQRFKLRRELSESGLRGSRLQPAGGRIQTGQSFF